MSINNQAINLAYWANPGANESADRKSGDAVVDSLTLEELVEFFQEHTSGPTYCLVKERVLYQLEKLPPKLQVNTLKHEAQIAFTQLQVKLRQLEIWMDAKIEFRK